MEHVIELTDGSKLAVKVNMLTVKLISECKLDRLLRKSNKLENKLESAKKEKEKERIADELQDIQMKSFSKMIWCILRSTGRKNIDEDDAMMLMPVDMDGLHAMFEDFQRQVITFKKKQASDLRQSPKLMKRTGRKSH